VEQRRARQHEHGVLLREPAHDLDVVEIGEPGAHVDRGRLALPEHEDDVTRDVTAAGAAPEPAAAGTTAATTTGALERGARCPHHILFFGRELLARHALLERGAHL